MDPSQLGSGNRICTVLFVDLVKYSEEPVSRQAEMKAQFEGILNAALEHTPAADRLVVDTGDGAAICFLGDPEDALFTANSLRGSLREIESSHRPLHLRLGINLGPVRVVKDINGHSNVIGDGINVAQRVMSFAVPDQILVSRSYFEVVSRLSPEYGQLFHYVGLHRDKHVREHEVYEVQLASAARRDGESEASAAVAAPAEHAARFEPALLARLAAVLAREIGPVAKLVVARAAARAPDGRGLCAMLADNVTEATRAAVLAELVSLAGAASPRGSPPDVDAFEAQVPGRREIELAVLTRAEQLLSHQIGPLARVLVRQAAPHAKDARDLFERLAVHIDNEEARKSFLAAADG